MTAADLAAYDVVEREPVCIDYRSYDVCGMGPPSSGGLAVGQILGILIFDIGTPSVVRAQRLVACDCQDSAKFGQHFLGALDRRLAELRFGPPRRRSGQRQRLA